MPKSHDPVSGGIPATNGLTRWDYDRREPGSPRVQVVFTDSVKSKVGKGSTFTVRIPMVYKEDRRLGEDPDAQEVPCAYPPAEEWKKWPIKISM